METITAAALRFGGLAMSVPAPGRHHHVIQRMARMKIDRRITCGADQGFITSTGRYVTREEGWCIAEAAGQLIGEPPVPGMLFSEDLW